LDTFRGEGREPVRRRRGERKERRSYVFKKGDRDPQRSSRKGREPDPTFSRGSQGVEGSSLKDSRMGLKPALIKGTAPHWQLKEKNNKTEERND